jgi:misacylated tRNA(Ala) deacylase
MTEALFKHDAYLQECKAQIIVSSNEFVVLDKTVFYPTGGGQPGDTGKIKWNDNSIDVIDTRYSKNGEIQHFLKNNNPLPAEGVTVKAEIDWDRRYRHMRMHTALHLLGSILKYGVTGGNIGAEKSRLDFDMSEPVDKDAVDEALQKLVKKNVPIKSTWISDEELDAQPDLVRTMSVKPPKGLGKVRLLEIKGIDIQPCGGTHVKFTGEIGCVQLGKVEKKGKHNRRVYVKLMD